MRSAVPTAPLPATSASSSHDHPPARALALVGASNFRDLGGYIGHGGRAVKWRQLFRSDHLAALTQQDHQVLATLGLGCSIDLRGQAESAAHAYRLPGVAYHHLDIEPTLIQQALAQPHTRQQLTAHDALELMHATYQGFVYEAAPRFAELFRLLLDGQPAPLVFHCTAGKDRTGFAAALILTALGVPRETVMHDYLLTNSLYRRPPGMDKLRMAEDVLAVFWRVEADYLQRAWELAERDFGSLHAYLADALGVDAAARQELAARYLAP